MKKTTIFGILALMVVGLMFSTNVVSAYRGDYETKGPECSEERHDMIMDAFNENDYEAWKILMNENSGKNRVLELVTEENFPLFVEAHQAEKLGNNELAQQLRAELGLNNGEQPRYMDGRGKDNSHSERKGSGQGAGFDKQFNKQQFKGQQIA
jgi:hypothetical protein